MVAQESNMRVLVQFESILKTYKSELILDKYRYLHEVLTQLDLIAEAFELISSSKEIEFEACERAYNILSQLTFLPRFRENQKVQTSQLQKEAEIFSQMNYALQEMTFDVVMAISKMSKLMNQSLKRDEKLAYDNTQQGLRLRNGINARRDH